MSTPIDNTDFLVAVHEILSTADLLLTKLNENNYTPEQKRLVGYIESVVSTQSQLIRQLTEYQIVLNEKLDVITENMEHLS